MSGFDMRRVRSFGGLALGRSGMRAESIVTGTFLTLLVATRTSSALLVTFALTAHQLLLWLWYPLIGRVSDRTSSRLGRRVPFLAGGMAGMAACAWLYTAVPGYWPLFGLVVAGKLLASAHGFSGFVLLPEVFGRRSWLKAVVCLGVAGTVVSVAVRLTVLSTWDGEDTATWAPAFRLAACVMAVSALVVLLFVRELPPPLPAGSGVVTLRERFRRTCATEEQRRLWTFVFVTTIGTAATARLYPVFLSEELDVSATTLALLPWIAVPLSVCSVGLILVLVRVLPPSALFVAPGLGMVANSLAQLVAPTVAWSLGATLVAGAVTSAGLVALLPSFLRLVPEEGSMGERIGVLYAPLGFALVGGAYLGAGSADLVGDLRAIYLVPAFLGVVAMVVVRRLAEPVPGRVILASLLPTLASLRAHNGGKLFRGAVPDEEREATALLDSLVRWGERMRSAGDTAGGPEDVESAPVS